MKNIEKVLIITITIVIISGVIFFYKFPIFTNPRHEYLSIKYILISLITLILLINSIINK